MFVFRTTKDDGDCVDDDDGELQESSIQRTRIAIAMNNACLMKVRERQAGGQSVSQAGKRVCARKRSLHSLLVSAI